ncbi:hypothetical protein LOK49_LG05G03564 [Camellia lanceoleosa]|uniref:Uncharacterized protein n=1 Tax=Camellia lanceoleosa TaxID=1840588 RepID=A0ACC0HKD4_9ERIC|nr:hypothetical protein LOK49_LG05G03564 [Camellia lanceoleosa]
MGKDEEEMRGEINERLVQLPLQDADNDARHYDDNRSDFGGFGSSNGKVYECVVEDVAWHLRHEYLFGSVGNDQYLYIWDLRTPSAGKSIQSIIAHQSEVPLFTRGKAPITQQLPGESEKDYADFSSKILHLEGNMKDIEFVKASLSAKGFDVVYDINVVLVNYFDSLLNIIYEDMACDTFLKIVQKYKRKFVIVQELIDVEGDGMADMVFRCIQEMDINNRMMLYQHIVLSGGSTIYLGLPSR